MSPFVASRIAALSARVLCRGMRSAIDSFMIVRPWWKESAKIRQLTNWRFWKLAVARLRSPQSAEVPLSSSPGESQEFYGERATGRPSAPLGALRWWWEAALEKPRMKLGSAVEEAPGEAAVWEIWAGIREVLVFKTRKIVSN